MLLALVIILYLTLTLIGMQFLQFSGKSEVFLFSRTAYKYSVFLSILILLFCAYMIIQQRKLLHLSRAFLREKETAYMLSRDVKTLSALLKVSSSINSKQKLSDILNIITRDMLACFHADNSSIMLLDQGSKVLKTKVCFGKGSEFAKDALTPIGKSIAGWVIKSGKPLLLNGQVDPADFPGTQKKNRRISSSLCVPLKIGEKSIGVLNVNLVDSDKTFSETHLKFIAIFANNAAVAIHNAMLSAEKSRRIRFQAMLERLHSPQVARELVKKIEDWNQPNKMREKLEVTILFADIRGFSGMLNVFKLEVIMDFLDEFYSIMTKAVFDNKGSIDKFIGDEVMAFFGAPIALKCSSKNGLKTAIEMAGYFQELKEKFTKQSPSFERLGLGIGVNTGEVFVGNVGSIKRYDFTVIGTAVNIARRLCSYAEADQILTTEKTLKKIHGKVSSEFVKNISFKGITEPVSLHKITSR